MSELEDYYTEVANKCEELRERINKATDEGRDVSKLEDALTALERAEDLLAELSFGDLYDRTGYLIDAHAMLSKLPEYSATSKEVAHV